MFIHNKQRSLELGTFQIALLCVNCCPQTSWALGAAPGGRDVLGPVNKHREVRVGVDDPVLEDLLAGAVYG